MGWFDKAIIAVSNLGKGLVINPITKLLDVSVSTDAGNIIVYGSDNGVMVPDVITPHINAAEPHPQYQSVLISGTNIKTVNGQSVLGSGDIVISGDGTVVPQGAATFEVDFGTTPVYDKTFVITVPGASASDVISVFEVPSEDPDMDIVTYTGLVTAVDEVTVYAQAIPGPVGGPRLLAINTIANILTPMESFTDDAFIQDIIMGTH